MTTLPDALAAALHDAVGAVDEAGRVTAGNAAMAELLAVAGGPRGAAADLVALGLGAADVAELRAQQPIELTVDGRHWRLRLATGAGGGAWLVATETTAVEHARSAVLELARLRALAGS